MKKVNGGIEKGVWVERDVTFVTLTFSGDVSESAFGIPNSCLDNAIQKLAEQRATVLAVSELYEGGTKVDLMLGHASGWAAKAEDGVLFADLTVDGYKDSLDPQDKVAATVSGKFAVFSGLREAQAADLEEFEYLHGDSEFFAKR